MDCPSGIGNIVSVRRDLWRAVASFVRLAGGWPRLGVLALGFTGLAASAGPGLGQVSEQQVRCMQLQQELAAAQGGGGSRADLSRIEQQIAKADRVFQGTQAAMEDAGCLDSFFIFGRSLVRSPKCLNMNARVEDARRQLGQLQQQRQALMGGGGGKRRQAELRDALARSGCGGQVRPARRGFFDFFGGREEEEEEQQLPQTPIYRSIDPNGRYRTVCVRLCDGFFYPIHYSTYGSMVGPDAEACQSNCAAPAELYVYRNPGQEIEQAVSLSGSAYMDLPVALRFRKEFVKGCSCKQAEYNPTDIMAANKQAGIETAPMPPAQPQQAPAPAGGDQAAAPAAATGDQPAPPPEPGVEITGTTPPADPAAAAPEQAAMPPPPETLPPPAADGPPPPPATAAIEQTPRAPKPAAVPQRQRPPAPPQAAAPPPPDIDSAAEVPPPPAPPKRQTPASPKASPFGQY